MKTKMLLISLMILVSISLVGGVCATGVYSIEFNQTDGNLIVSQNISGNYSTYIDSENLEKTGSGYAFIHKITFDSGFDSAFIRLNLDKGFIIKDGEAYPSNYKLETDGQTISLVWKLENVVKGDNFAMFVVIEDTNSNIVMKIVLAILIIAVFGAIACFSYSRYVKSNSKKETKFEKHLLESEKKIIEELKKSEKKELWQKELQIKTGFSKAKLSRVIRDLESRGLIRKIPLGNTNKVILK